MRKFFYNICCITFILFFTSTALSQTIKNDTLRQQITTDFFVDNPIAAMLDSLAVSVLFKGKNLFADTVRLNIYNYQADDVPQFSDSIYKVRIKNMRTQSPIKFVYHDDVRRFIDLYAQRRRTMTSRLLGLGEYYFPLFEEQLAKHNLPLELKYLAVIESALNPKAISRAGAGGLWQFMYRTGKMYGLEVTSYVDDRFDPYKATIAACEHFVDLYRIYKDWNLVLAAYNAGSGNVNRAIRRANGEMDYWKIRRFLPRETQSYVPIFMAASYVMMHAAEHNLYPVYPGYLFEKNDTITIKNSIGFEQISEALNISTDELAALNPSFKRNVIPSTDRIQYKLKMPVNKIGEFLANEEELYNFKTLEELIKEDLMARNPGSTFSTDKTHTVKSGETLSVISRRHGVTIGDIQKWNNLRGTTIHPGQNLVVGVAPVKLPTPKIEGNIIIEHHIAQPNESLRSIADLYNCSVDNIRLWNNIKNLSITSGQKLIIHIVKPEEEIEDIEDITEGANNTPEITGESIILREHQTDNQTLNTDSVYFFYTVKHDDTLQKIADMHSGICIEEVKKINSLKSSEIKPGQKLKLPLNNI